MATPAMPDIAAPRATLLLITVKTGATSVGELLEGVCMRKRFRSVFAPMVTMLMLVQSLIPGVWAQNEQYVIRHDAIKAWETAMENRAEDDASANDEVTPDLNGDEDSGTGEGDAGEGMGSGDEPVTQPQAPFVIPPTPVELKELQLIAVQATCAVPASLDIQPLQESDGIKKVELEPGNMVAAGWRIDSVSITYIDGDDSASWCVSVEVEYREGLQLTDFRAGAMTHE